MAEQPKELAALYYPFSRCLDAPALKRSLIYFDRVYFLDPYNLDQRDNAIITSHYYDGIVADERELWSDLIESAYKPLENEGWIASIDVESLVRKYDAELTENTLSDLTDPKFCSYSFGDIDINVEKVCWHMLHERMPQSLLAYLGEVKWQDFKNSVALNAARFAPFGIPTTGST